MWGIRLINANGEQIEDVAIDAPFEALRGWCRRLVESTPDAAQARLISTDGSFDYVYPEQGRGRGPP